MILDQTMPLLGPFVLIANVLIIFACLRPKHGMIFTIAVLAACAVIMHLLITFVLMKAHPLSVKFCGVLLFPIMLRLFKGQIFQKLFAIIVPYQLGALTTHLADALVGVTLGYENPHAQIMYLGLSIIMLGIYVTFVLRFGRKFFDRMFVDGNKGKWALYSLGAALSMILVLSMDWTRVGAPLYFIMMLFLLWSVGVLCYTIINMQEKAAQAHHTEMLLLQMNSLREQADADKKHRADMQILRHDMRHEMDVIMELFRTGKIKEAEEVYSDWKTSLTESVPAVLCAEPVLNAVLSRYERRANDKDISMYVISDIPDILPVDTIKLSVMVSNALENALAATDKVTEQNKRCIDVKLVYHDTQIGLEVTNPCASPVEFDGKGFPITNKSGHGIGIRSIAAFADNNGYLLTFNYQDGKFTLRLVMGFNKN